MKTLKKALLFSIAAIVAFAACKKRDDAPAKPLTVVGEYINKMGGTRIWHGADTGYWNQATDTGYIIASYFNNTLTDTFALKVNGADSTVTFTEHIGQLYSGVYKYASIDTVVKSILLIQYMPGVIITYYYAADSIVIMGTYASTQGVEYTYLKTP